MKRLSEWSQILAHLQAFNEVIIQKIIRMLMWFVNLRIRCTAATLSLSFAWNQWDNVSCIKRTEKKRAIVQPNEWLWRILIYANTWTWSLSSRVETSNLTQLNTHRNGKRNYHVNDLCVCVFVWLCCKHFVSCYGKLLRWEKKRQRKIVIKQPRDSNRLWIFINFVIIRACTNHSNAFGSFSKSDSTKYCTFFSNRGVLLCVCALTYYEIWNRWAYRRQSSTTTITALNMRPDDRMEFFFDPPHLHSFCLFR